MTSASTGLQGRTLVVTAVADATRTVKQVLVPYESDASGGRILAKRNAEETRFPTVRGLRVKSFSLFICHIYFVFEVGSLDSVYDKRGGKEVGVRPKPLSPGRTKDAYSPGPHKLDLPWRR